MLRFGKQAEKLREALGPAREIDVWISKLRGLRASIEKPGDYVLPQLSEECARDRSAGRAAETEAARQQAKKLAASIEEKDRPLWQSGGRISGRHRTNQDCLMRRGICRRTLLPTFSRGRAEFCRCWDGSESARFSQADQNCALPGGTGTRGRRPGLRAHRHADEEAAGAIGEWHDWQALAGHAACITHGASPGRAACELSTETLETRL